MNVRTDVLLSVFQMVSAHREKTEYCQDKAERTPYTPIPIDDLNQCLQKVKASGNDAYKIVSFAISIVAGLMEDDGVYKLNCANRGNLIVQAEALKVLRTVTIEIKAQNQKEK